MAQDSIIKKIELKERELKDWHDRQDTDLEFYWLEEYSLTNYNAVQYSEAYSVTRNTPLVYAQALQGDLNSSEIIFKVESNELSTAQTSTVESWIKDILASADLWATNTYGVSMYKATHEHIAIRGAVNCRVLMQVEDDKIITDLKFMDPRWCTWEYGRDGTLSWHAYSVKMNKDQAISTLAINEDVEAAILKAFKSGDDANVIEYFGMYDEGQGEGCEHRVYINTQLIFDEEFGDRVPIVQRLSSLGSTLIDTDNSVEHMGESIYFAMRNLYDEMNRLASIAMSKSMESYRRALVLTGGRAGELPAKGSLATPPAKAGPKKKKAVTQIHQIEGGATLGALYPVEDMTGAESYIGGVLSGDQQASQYSAIDYGVLERDMSGALANILSDKRKRIIGQLVEDCSSLWVQILFELARQMESEDISGPLGVQGRKSNYSHADIDGEYLAEVEHRTTFPEETIAKYALAKQAQDLGFDLESILDTVMEVQEPKKMLLRARLDEERKVNPRLNKLMLAFDLADAGLDLYSELILIEFDMTMDELQIQTEQVKQALEGTEGGPPLPALLNGGSDILPQTTNGGEGPSQDAIKINPPQVDAGGGPPKGFQPPRVRRPSIS